MFIDLLTVLDVNVVNKLRILGYMLAVNIVLISLN